MNLTAGVKCHQRHAASVPVLIVTLADGATDKGTCPAEPATENARVVGDVEYRGEHAGFDPCFGHSVAP